MDSASLCSLAGRYDNRVPTLFLAPTHKKNIPHIKELQNGAVAKSWKGFLVYEEMHKYLTIYEEAVSHI